MRPTPTLRSRATILALLLALSPVSASAAAGPPPPPKPEQVRACLDQVAASGGWTFEWKSITVGEPRHPLNPYEAIGHPDRDFYGYPVRVVYNFNGVELIDANYWFSQDTQGRWQLPFLCVTK